MCDIFTMKDEHSYAAFVGVLSTLYMKAHASAPFRAKPYRAKIYCSKSMTVPYKGQPDTSIARLKAIAERMLEPDGGISLSVCVGDSQQFDAKIGLKHSVSQAWPIVGHKNAEHVSVNLPPKRLRTGATAVRYFEWAGGDVHIDYDTPIKKVFEVLSRSRVHVSYQGGSAWLSAAMGIPTLIVHPAKAKPEIHMKSRLFGQQLGQINILESGKIRAVRQHPCERSVTLQGLDEALRDYP